MREVGAEGLVLFEAPPDPTRPSVLFTPLSELRISHSAFPLPDPDSHDTNHDPSQTRPT